MRNVLFLCLGLIACGHTETHAAMLRPAEARAVARPVELYMAEQPLPTRPFSELALVQSIGFGSDAHPEDVAHALADRAAAAGCDAVIRVFIDIGYARAHAAGTCVKWLGPGPAGPAPDLPKGQGANPSPPPMRPAPAPRIEPLPSTAPGTGSGR